ncbi:unnamed protein product [Caenorhabditis brenneri]
MPFPFLRLPLLASINVIKNISVTQIINLIYTSSKVQELVKISKYPVQLDVCPKSITLEHPMNPEKLEVLIVVRSELEEHQKQIMFQQNHEQGVFTEWNDEMEGYRRIIDFLVQNFTVKCFSFKKRDYDSEVLLEYLEYPKSHGIKLDKVCIWEGSKNEQLVDRMLSACSEASEFKLMLDCDRNFTFNGFHEFKMDTFDFFLSCVGQWFTADHMCALINCSEVIVKHFIRWKAVDFNKFLKFWIQSTGRLRAVYLNACYSEFNPELAMNGINNIELERNTTFQIQRDNGMKARVMFSNALFFLQVIET